MYASAPCKIRRGVACRKCRKCLKNEQKSSVQVSCVGAVLTVSSNLDSQHPPPQKRAECKTRKFAQSNQSWTQALSGEMKRLGAMKTGTKRYNLAWALIFITSKLACDRILPMKMKLSGREKSFWNAFRTTYKDTRSHYYYCRWSFWAMQNPGQTMIIPSW